MTITSLAAPAPNTNDADLAVLSVSRLLTRLEHNLLSPGADLVGLRKSEFQRMRVGANIEYARSNLHSLERSIPSTKPLDRRHTLQTEVQRHRETLKRLQALLEQINADAETRAVSSSSGQGDYDDNDDEESIDGEDLLGTPEESSTENEPGREEGEKAQGQEDKKEQAGDGEPTNTATATPATTTTTTTTPITTAAPATAPTPTATLRNRNTTSPSSPPSHAKTTGSDHISSTAPSDSKAQDTEQTLSTHRAEQEDLTSSLLSLASQLKSSSQAFQTSLDSEKSVLARAVDGLDRTTGNMQAAERRMGMLRRMTEGKGWWGRMMLYAWILGLWVVAVLIVFLGPKLRF